MKIFVDRIIQAVLQQIPAIADCNMVRVVVEPTKNKAHGDYAVNAAMVLAPQIKTKPRDLAELIAKEIPTDGLIEKVEIAGPGFINLFLKISEIENFIDVMHDSDNLAAVAHSGIDQGPIVIDLSSPNLAKEMHVGHLRSTIIGDSVGRVLKYLGHTVILQNHVGDWGTQFGMLLAQMELSEASGADTDLKDLEAFYIASKKSFDSSPEFADRARQLVVALQSGDPETLAKWNAFRETSLAHCQDTYDRLGVDLKPENVKGESFYNPGLPGIIESLAASNMLAESDGAQCVFLDGYKNIDGDPLPMIVQKAGGGYLYSTTDLAAIKHRSQDLNAGRVLYFVDKRQGQHFEMVFKIAKQAGFAGDNCTLEHMAFGTMNGKDGRPFRSRDGGTVKLADLLDEAQERAFALVKQKNPDMADNQAKAIADVVSVAAVKYADLSKHRTSDYVFDFDQMLSFEGNTAPYLLYAYTRCAGVFRKLDRPMFTWNSVRLVAEQEVDLGKQIVKFGDVLNDVALNGTPHTLCGYLYELAVLFSSFYEHCPILSDNIDIITHERRLALVVVTGKVLKEGLSLLGIQTLEQM